MKLYDDDTKAKWTTDSGRKIKVRDMSTPHLTKMLKMLNRKKVILRLWGEPDDILVILRKAVIRYFQAVMKYELKKRNKK